MAIPTKESPLADLSNAGNARPLVSTNDCSPHIARYFRILTLICENANHLNVTILSDFQPNPPYSYQHSSLTGTERIINKMLKEGHLRFLNPLKEFSDREMKKFNELYLAESSGIVSQDIALLCKPANRIGIKVAIDISEANIIIYGYEITLKLLQTLLSEVYCGTNYVASNTRNSFSFWLCRT
jgi:hypothetical protein